MCPPRSDNGCPQGQHALMDAVIGRAWNVPRPVPTARKPIHPTVPDLPTQRVGDGFGWPAPNTETVVAEDIDQLGDGRRPLLCQVQGEHIAELDSAQAESIHPQTVTCLSDIDRDCRCEAGKLGTAPSGAREKDANAIPLTPVPAVPASLDRTPSSKELSWMGSPER
jgi:hypothetical protein